VSNYYYLLSGRRRQENKSQDDDDVVTFLEEQKRERLPDLVILIRHGQSEGNTDKTKWWSKPDSQIELTKVGIEQAKRAGKRIEDIFQFYEQTLGVPMDRVHVHVSPFKRTIQTAKYVREAFEDRVVRQNLCPRLREQEFGNLQSDEFNKYREEQKRVGRFWYRFPTGESGADGKRRCQ
jgi:broad specificity phosphatase PhoE